MSSFDEAGSPGTPEPRGEGWRRVVPGAMVRAYLASGWRQVEVSDVNDLTREIRVVWPPRGPGDGGSQPSHETLDAALYEPPEGGFPRPPG